MKCFDKAEYLQRAGGAPGAAGAGWSVLWQLRLDATPQTATSQCIETGASLLFTPRQD